MGFRAGVLASLLYSLLRTLLDVTATSRGDQAQLQAEVLALRRQIQVLERQIVDTVQGGSTPYLYAPGQQTRFAGRF